MLLSISWFAYSFFLVSNDFVVVNLEMVWRINSDNSKSLTHKICYTTGRVPFKSIAEVFNSIVFLLWLIVQIVYGIFCYKIFLFTNYLVLLGKARLMMACFFADRKHLVIIPIASNATWSKGSFVGIAYTWGNEF